MAASKAKMTRSEVAVFVVSAFLSAAVLFWSTSLMSSAGISAFASGGDVGPGSVLSNIMVAGTVAAAVLLVVLHRGYLDNR